jgi:hypothetical protein
MCDYGRTIPLNAQTEALVAAEIARRVAAQGTFYALDVTNAVKQAGGIGRHRDMAPAVREAFLEGGMEGYEMHPTLKIDFRGAREEAYLYAPVGADPTLIDAELAREVQPLKPNAGSDGVGQRYGSPVQAPAPVFSQAGLGAWLLGDDSQDDEAEDDEPQA